jgi:UDP-glucose 4-epimerase
MDLPMRIGLTGGTGLIGHAWLERTARPAGDTLDCLARHLPEQSPAGDFIHWRKGDLMSYPDCCAFVKELDAVVHLAAAGLPLTAGRSLPDDLSLNLLPTLNLIQAIRDSGRPIHLVYPSSGGQVYGRSPARVPWRESDPCQPVSAYGVHKLTAENYLRLLAEEGVARCTVLRISNVYGAPVPPERLQGFLGTAVHELQRGRPVRLIGDTSNVRDHVHLDDVCTALDWALQRPGSSHEVFNIGSGQGHSVDQLLALLRGQWPVPVTTVQLPTLGQAKSLIPWNVLDVARAAQAGWSARVPMAAGIARLLPAGGAGTQPWSHRPGRG